MKTNFISTLLILFFLNGTVLSAQDETESVVKFIDASTYVTNYGRILNLEGISTPDIDTSQGETALSFVKNLFAEYQISRVEYDEKHQNRKSQDLVYLFLKAKELPKNETADGMIIKKIDANSYEIFLNAYLIKHGMAKTTVTPPNKKYMELFFDTEETARMSEVGNFQSGIYW